MLVNDLFDSNYRPLNELSWKDVKKLPGRAVGATAGTLGAVAGGLTSGVGRAVKKGFERGARAVGGAPLPRAAAPAAPAEPLPAVTSTIYNPRTGKPYTRQEYAAIQAQQKLTTAPSAAAAPAGDAEVVPAPTPAAAKTSTLPQLAANFREKILPKLNKKQLQILKRAVDKSLTKIPTSPTKPWEPTEPAPRRVATMESKKFLANTLTQVRSMLKEVRSQDDIRQIKNFIDREFTRHGLIEQSHQEIRNCIIERVVYLGAKQRALVARSR